MSEESNAMSAAREQFEGTASHSFEENESGLWCPLCGNHLAARHNMDETYIPPEVCPQCGFPDEIDPEAI